MKPLKMDLCLTGAFFIFIGFVVWVEHRENKEFRGLPHKQVGFDILDLLLHTRIIPLSPVLLHILHI